MRNYDTDIEELYERIEALELEKKQRNQIPAKKRKNKKRPVVKDVSGVKQVRAPENLLITDDVRKPAGTDSTRAKRK